MVWSHRLPQPLIYYAEIKFGYKKCTTQQIMLFFLKKPLCMYIIIQCAGSTWYNNPLAATKTNTHYRKSNTKISSSPKLIHIYKQSDSLLDSMVNTSTCAQVYIHTTGVVVVAALNIRTYLDNLQLDTFISLNSNKAATNGVYNSINQSFIWIIWVLLHSTELSICHEFLKTQIRSRERSVAATTTPPQ